MVLPLERGDEIVLCGYDYPHTLNAWKQRAKREGIVLRWAEPVLPSDDETAIVHSYQRQI